MAQHRYPTPATPHCVCDCAPPPITATDGQVPLHAVSSRSPASSPARCRRVRPSRVRGSAPPRSLFLWSRNDSQLAERVQSVHNPALSHHLPLDEMQ
jgi:hypothetical protein